jgi:DNA polymerase I
MSVLELARQVYSKLKAQRNGLAEAPPGRRTGSDRSDRSDQSSGTAFTDRYVLISDPAKLQSVLGAIDESAQVGLDCETVGLNPRTGRVRLLSLATDRGTWVIDCFAVDPSPLWEALAERPVVGHNLVFDLSFLAGLGFTPGPVRDIMILSQLLHAGLRESHKLQDCVPRELGRDLPKDLQTSDWSGSLSPAQLEYAAVDAQIVLPLFQVLNAKARSAGMVEVADIEHRCLPALVWLARSGAPFDVATWKGLAREADEAARRLVAEMDAAAPRAPQSAMFPGCGRNWDSHVQVKQAFAAAGVVLESTRDKYLARVNHPLAALLRQYRDARKRATAFGDDWLRHVAPDGRVYASWKQALTASGRMSCSDPNLQQVPRGAHRGCFRAPAGRVLVKADYSQIELRIAAKVSGDKAMLDAYRAGLDLHTLTAQRLLGRQDVSKADRQVAKSANFGLVYGMGAKGYQAYARTKYGVELTEAEAEGYRAAFFRTYSGLAQWHGRVRRAHKMETRTLAGRRRLLDANTFDTHRFNSPVQGTGADGLKQAMALLWEQREQCPGAFPVLVVHDEIVVECAAEQADAVSAWLRQAMLDGMAPLIDPVPVEVEVRVGQTWGGD